MRADYNQYTDKHDLFPRKEQFNAKRLICGHLNRLKYPPNIQTYFAERQARTNRRSALAKASRCFCNIECVMKNERKTFLADIIENFNGIKSVVDKLENSKITEPF